MFCWASIWKTNSLPRRRAGSPVQASAGPSTANFTPATCSSSAMALVAFFARSSSAPAQPTQYRYSTSSGILPSRTGTSKSSSVIQSSALVLGHAPRVAAALQVVEHRGRLRCGKADSTRTWWRRIPLMWSMCSMSTGHSFTHAPQFVHDQITSGSMTPFCLRGPDQRPLRLGLDVVGELVPRLVGAGQQVRGLGERVVAQVQDDLLGRQRLAGRPRPGTATGSGRTRCRCPGRAGPSRSGPRSCRCRTRRCPGRPPRSPAPCRLSASARAGRARSGGGRT